MELSRLRQGDLVAGIGGVALLVVMFLDWYAAGGSASFQGREIDISLGFNAWQAFSITDLILALTALSGIALAVLTAARRSPALPVAAGVITSTLGALASLLVFYRILNQPGPNEFVEVKFGAFLGFLAVLAVAVGGYLAMRDEEGEDAPMAVEVRPTPAPEGLADPAPPPEAERGS
jgi:hypothetical protein